MQLPPKELWIPSDKVLAQPREHKDQVTWWFHSPLAYFWTRNTRGDADVGRCWQMLAVKAKSSHVPYDFKERDGRKHMEKGERSWGRPTPRHRKQHRERRVHSNKMKQVKQVRFIERKENTQEGKQFSK